MMTARSLCGSAGFCAEPDDAHRLTCAKCREAMGPDKYRDFVGHWALEGLRRGREHAAALKRLRAKVERGEIASGSGQFTAEQVLREMGA